MSSVTLLHLIMNMIPPCQYAPLCSDFPDEVLELDTSSIVPLHLLEPSMPLSQSLTHH